MGHRKDCLREELQYSSEASKRQVSMLCFEALPLSCPSSVVLKVPFWLVSSKTSSWLPRLLLKIGIKKTHHCPLVLLIVFFGFILFRSLVELLAFLFYLVFETRSLYAVHAGLQLTTHLLYPPGGRNYRQFRFCFLITHSNKLSFKLCFKGLTVSLMFYCLPVCL